MYHTNLAPVDSVIIKFQMEIQYSGVCLGVQADFR